MKNLRVFFYFIFNSVTAVVVSLSDLFVLRDYSGVSFV